LPAAYNLGLDGNDFRSEDIMAAKVAVIQKPPVLLDHEKTIARTVASSARPQDKGATLLIFPEAYIPGYPTWIWRLKPGGDMGFSNEIHARVLANASI
jgi:nitrilase